MTKSQITELKRLESVATKGIWEADVNGDDQNIILASDLFYGDDEDDATQGFVANCDTCYDMPEKEKYANAVFIAAARNALPELLLEREKMLEVIRFYGDHDNWYFADEAFAMISCDDRESDESKTGGKRARELLESIGE